MLYELELSTAINTAHRTGELQLKARLSDQDILSKADRSPITPVDKVCEELIRNNLLKTFPNDGFIGEEYGKIEGSSGRYWIVDPLDGTRPFIRGIPTYGVLIALEETGIPVVGVIHLPALNCTCWASKGGGAYLNGKPIHVSSTPVLASAMGSALGFLSHPQQSVREKLLKLMSLWDYAYGFMDAFSYICVASGKLDLCVSLLDKPWDCAAAACIVTEAGGEYSDITGQKSVHNGSIIISNGALHGSALDCFIS